MIFLYNCLVGLSWNLLRLVAFFDPKIALFVRGRQQSFARLEAALEKNHPTIWVHAASLGEYEQGLPVMEALKKAHPSHKMVLTFFSPSGYEVRQGNAVADVTVYLPMDTKAKVAKFLDTVRPRLAIFIKYELWPNYLMGLKKRRVPTVLISALFKPEQIYFKPYGGFMRKALLGISHFFVQNEASKQLLAQRGFPNATVAGDTRMDRVAAILDRDNALPFMKTFKGDRPCLVAGSTWPADEAILVPYINANPEGPVYVLAPHNIKKEDIAQLKASITLPTLLYSERSDANPADHKVLIMDTIGLLTKVYAYADFGYVGGGFGTGLHNTLEPAVFGIPIMVGPEYKGFFEAETLVAKGGIKSVGSTKEFADTMDALRSQKKMAATMGAVNAAYVQEQKGATRTIMEHVGPLLKEHA
ncbi:3-deoxy-D-manno-octulosonic acid transferase [Maribacter sp. 2307ULW6-5]|uniref:3-deoxy-D-manno-octulosonic acid transferase n=1 Tax=Maribacter sp. 2307ULW6-5 TaxID=3386275 RepID=UPI0039BC6D71